MSKRTLLMVVALIASVAIAATGTLAYLTDTDSDVNVMTLGNVDIEQHEMKRVDGIAYNDILEEGDLEPFTDGIKLFPAYPKTDNPEDAYNASQDEAEAIKWGPYVHDSGAWNCLWNDENLVGAVDKMIFVENTGSSDAYVRTILAFEKPEGIMIGYGSEHADIVLNMNGNYRFTNSNGTTSTTPMCEIEIDGTTYEVYEFTYSEIMKPGEWTRPSLLQVVMTNWATNETVALLGETYEVLAVSQGVQVTNLEELGAQGALDAAFGKVNVENATKWFSEMAGLPVTTASTADELVAALAQGGTILLTEDVQLDDAVSVTEPAEIALNGNTLTVSRLEIADEVTISGGTLEHGESDYPAVSVNGGSLTMDSVEIINDDKPCNVFTSGSLKAVESVALQVFEGDCVLNDCTIYIKHSEKTYASNVVGISVHEGAVTMNGGSITVESAGASNSRYNSDAALFTCRPGDKTITLNNVTINAGTAPYLYTSEGNTVVNTTDASGSWDGKVTGPATVNYK